MIPGFAGFVILFRESCVECTARRHGRARKQREMLEFAQLLQRKARGNPPTATVCAAVDRAAAAAAGQHMSCTKISCPR